MVTKLTFLVSKIEESKKVEPIKKEPVKPTTLDFFQLPERYRPIPISEEEINAINVNNFNRKILSNFNFFLSKARWILNLDRIKN